MSISNGKLKIGEVHAALREQFPDIELSKLRYYEDRGLVVPSRSKRVTVSTLKEMLLVFVKQFVWRKRNSFHFALFDFASLNKVS